MNNFALKIVLVYVVIFILVGVLSFLDIISNELLVASIYAGILNLLNTFTAVKLFNRSINASSSSFMINTLGGLGLRLFVIIIAVILIIKVLNIDKYGFILVFFLFYFISLIFEVLLYLKISKKKQ